MPRILAIDYGLKRCGLAVTDPLQMIASPLETVETGKILEYLKAYIKKEEVESLIIGMPAGGDGPEPEIASNIRSFKKVLQKHFPSLPVYEVDESFTSKMAVEAMIRGGMKKKDRRKKGNIDKISAALILQIYMRER